MLLQAINWIIKAAYHSLPLWPIIYGNRNLTIAALLAVALPYVKVRKLAGEYEELGGVAAQTRQALRTRRALAFWQYFTFGKKSA